MIALLTSVPTLIYLQFFVARGIADNLLGFLRLIDRGGMSAMLGAFATILISIVVLVIQQTPSEERGGFSWEQAFIVWHLIEPFLIIRSFLIGSIVCIFWNPDGLPIALTLLFLIAYTYCAYSICHILKRSFAWYISSIGSNKDKAYRMQIISDYIKTLDNEELLNFWRDTFKTMRKKRTDQALYVKLFFDSISRVNSKETRTDLANILIGNGQNLDFANPEIVLPITKEALNALDWTEAAADLDIE